MRHSVFACGLLLMAAACAEARHRPEVDCGEQYSGTVPWSDRLDVLFVVDTSPSMMQERAKLLSDIPGAAQFLIEGLAPDGFQFERTQNFHVGVISADLGSEAGAADGCTETGADARLQAAPECHASRGDFVWHRQEYHDATDTTAAMSCIASLEPSSCTVSQPLKAALEAFERNRDFESSTSESVSTLAIVIVTDRDDASLGPISDYVHRLQTLRPKDELLVHAAVIAGVPPDLLSPTLKEARGQDDDKAVVEIYRRMLDDPRLVPTSLGEPSCVTASATAYAPRRLIEFAAEWPSRVELHSICDYELGNVLSGLAGYFAKRIYPVVCLQKPVPLDDRGRAPCRVTWELPRESDPDEPFTPATCEDRPDFLTVPGGGRPSHTKNGQTRCEVRQAPVARDATGALVPDGEGFFVGAPAEDSVCSTTAPLQIHWTKQAIAPPGVRVLVECGKEALDAAADSCEDQRVCVSGWACDEA